jgi:4-hydroxy-tetrahydrodipicolinate reductase
MNIALVGYGKMGKLIEQLAEAKGHKIVAIIDSKEIVGNLNDADVIIDFSHPDSVLETVKTYAKLQKNFVIGTTGWYDRLDELKELVNHYQFGLIYAPNFSIGVNLFMKIVGFAAEMMNPFEEYDVGGYEQHHAHKVDKPSGTALAMIELLMKKMDRKKQIVQEHFSSLRCGSNPGLHRVLFDSPIDTISIEHQAHSREGFALGAIRAAEWLQGKKGLFTIDDMLD